MEEIRPNRKNRRGLGPGSELRICEDFYVLGGLIVQTMNSYSGTPYSAVSNSCATAVVDALGAAGIGLDQVATGSVGLPNLPTTAGLIAIMQPGATSTFLRSGAEIPADLNQFNPGSSGTPTPTTIALPGSLNQSNAVDPNQPSSLPSVISGKQ
jgi:hypothetical protein